MKRYLSYFSPQILLFFTPSDLGHVAVPHSPWAAQHKREIHSAISCLALENTDWFNSFLKYAAPITWEFIVFCSTDNKRILMAKWGVLFLIIFSSAVLPLLQVPISEQSWKQLGTGWQGWGAGGCYRQSPGASAAAKEPIQHDRGDRKLFENAVTV